VVACGKSSSEPAETSSSKTTVSSGVSSPAAGPTGATGIVTPPGPTGATGGGGGSYTGCGGMNNAARSFYEYYKQGTGPSGAVYTTYADITADQRLRVSIEPSGAGATQGT